MRLRRCKPARRRSKYPSARCVDRAPAIFESRDRRAIGHPRIGPADPGRIPNSNRCRGGWADKPGPFRRGRYHDVATPLTGVRRSDSSNPAANDPGARDGNRCSPKTPVTRRAPGCRKRPGGQGQRGSPAPSNLYRPSSLAGPWYCQAGGAHRGAADSKRGGTDFTDVQRFAGHGTVDRGGRYPKFDSAPRILTGPARDALKPSRARRDADRRFSSLFSGGYSSLSSGGCSSLSSGGFSSPASGCFSRPSSAGPGYRETWRSSLHLEFVAGRACHDFACRRPDRAPDGRRHGVRHIARG